MRSTAFVAKALRSGKTSVSKPGRVPVAKPGSVDLTDLNKALEQRGDKIPDAAIHPRKKPVKPKHDEPVSWENLPGGLPPTRWV